MSTICRTTSTAGLVNAGPAGSFADSAENWEDSTAFRFEVGESVMFLRANWSGTIVARRLDRFGTPVYDIKGDAPADVLFCGEPEASLIKRGKNWQTGK